jgi:hypothetical protein
MRSRATVLSLQSQADALGQTTGRPHEGVATATVAAGLLLLPALSIFATQLRGSDDPPPPPGD